MLRRCLETSAALLLAATFAAPRFAPRAAAAPGETSKGPATRGMPLSKAMSGDIVVNVPVTITLPADYEPLHEPKDPTRGTFWGTREALRAAVRGGEVDTTKL